MSPYGNSYFDTTAIGDFRTWQDANTATWVQRCWPATVEKISRRAWELLMLVSLRWWHLVWDLRPAWELARRTVSPRRNVVPRGFVSWVRMGTRRPL